MGAGHHIRKEKCNIMSRFTKLLAAVALLGIPLAACDEGTVPPPVGSISGTVSIEGTGVDGVSVNLSNGNSTTTAGGGSYRFDNVEGGAYTVTISGFPSDATFDATSAAATISSAGQSVTLNFTGAYIRTASVMGSVTVENMGLPGVTVTLTGVSSATATTDDSGQYAFTGLRMGSYSVEISGFDNDEVGFSNTASAVTVGVGESKIVSFDGTYLRTAGIQGRVSVEGAGLEGVNVSLSGGPDGVSETTTTDASGQYSFAKLRAGDYAVGISGYNTDDYEFEVTSQNVTVALGETANVPFEGVLLRTSGISGRVSVEGMGLEGITVTLSMADAEDMTTATDAGGTYAFSGLAAGTYTVSIAVESDAYVFESMSMDVTVADDEVGIVNFEGAHARTASVSGMLFIDELMKNDMYDEGEDPLPHAGVPVVLVGPGVNDQMPSATDSTGAYSFMGLRAGSYQLVVPVTGPMGDFAYGGSATGYAIELGVGAAHTQNLPVDITHTTVHFGVTLKAGETRGMPLPGAMVSVYSDAMGETKIGDGMTMVNEETMHAVASIRVPRAGTSGNMVYAGVAAEGYHVGDGLTAVTWDPQKTYTQGANENDVLNLMVDVSVSGATVMTEYGGGEPLAGWAISIGHGDVMEADTLDDDGMASFKMELPEAVLPMLPKAFTFSVNAEQDDDLDGGEMFEATSFEYMHTGLSLMGTMEGALEGKYTTQTLMVSVYHEVDQVPGFTGNIGTGDASTTCSARDDDNVCVTGVELQLRHETPSNRRNTIDPDVWRWDTSGSDRTVWVDKGVYTFKNLPADLNLFVLADEIGHVEIVPADNLAAYENLEDNGVEGGAFGPEGGFSHTVRLCPGRTRDPTGQDHGECGSFGFVHTHTVAAHVKKRIVETDNDEGFKAERDINVTGVELGLTPTAGKNMAGEAESITTLKSAVRSAGEGSSSSAWDDEVDERQDLYFGRMAEGVYGFSLTSKWAAYLNGDARIGKEYRLKADDVMDVTDRTGADGPFRPGDDSEGVYFEVRPTTSTLYGFVNDDSGDPIEDVEVTVNGVTVMTDIDGRYIAPDFSRMTSRASRTAGSKLYISFSKTGYDTLRDDPNHARSSSRYQIADADGAKNGIDFQDNDPQQLDVVLEGSQLVATITGTVTDKDGDPVAGVDLTVVNEAGEDVLNNRQWISAIGAYCTVDAVNCRRTGDDGTYEMQVKVTDDDEDYTITPSKNRYYFDNTTEQETLEAGDSEDGVDFEALRQSRIRGSVEDADGDNMGGVTVTATALDRDPVYAPSDETNDNGRFTIWVDGDETYNVMAMADGYTFGNTEDDDNLRVRVDDDELHDIGTFTGTVSDVGLSSVTVNGATVAAGDDGNYATEVANTVEQATIVATAANSSATVTYSGTDADATMAGHQVDLSVGANATTVTVTAPSAATMDYTVTVTRLDPVTLPDRKVTLVLGTNPIRENRGESAITATLNRAADAPFNVTVSAPAVADGHSFTVSDNTELYFAAGATSSSSSSLGDAVTITAVPDNDYTGDTEVTVSGTVSGDGVAAPDDVMLTITEDDEPVRVSMMLSKTSIDEADDAATTDDVENASRLSVTLDRAAEAELTVAITLVGTGFNPSGADLTAGTGDTATASITVAAGATASTDTITITAVDDENEMDHSVTISGEATPEAGLLQPADVTLMIEDDDEAPSAVTGLAASADTVAVGETTKDVTLTWTAPTSFGSEDGTDTDATTVVYQYRTKLSGAPSWGAWTDITPTDGSGDDAGKQVGTVASQDVNRTHQYQVRARATSTGPTGPDGDTAELVIPAAPTS